MSNIEEKLKSLQNVLIERGYNATTQNEKADLRSKLKSLQDVLIKRGYTPKSVSSQEDSLFGKTSKSTFETMPKYQENKQKYQKEKEDKLNAMYDKYGINPEKFSYGDFEKWAKNHNFEYQLVGDTPQNTRRVLAPKKDEKGASLASNEEISDKNTLEQLAENNDRRKTSNSDKGSMGAFALKAMDGMTLGAYSKLSDKQTKKKYEEAGLNPNEFISDTQAYKKTFDDHKIASNLGDLAGSTVSLIGLGEVVGGALKGVKWLAKAPTWVQSAVKEGITFGLKQGTETAIDGGGAKDIAKETAIGVAGGAAGGATSSVVGKVGEDVLFKTRLQNKIIPEIIKNGTASASFAGADSAATYFLHPKEERPTAGDIAKNMGVTFAFAAITTGINAGRIKQSSKEALDVVNDKMMKDYESMMNSASTNDVESVKQFAKNVMDYSDSMIKYLDGEGFKLKNDAPSDTVTEYLTGKGNAPVKDTVLEKARFVGEDARVRSMQEDLRTIKSRAKEFYDRVDSIPYDVEKISKTSNVGNVDNVTKEPININHTKSTSQTENLIQNVPKTSETEPIQTVQEQTPVNIKTSNVELRKTDELSEEVQDNTSKADVITENNQKQFNENQRQQNNVDNQADLSDVSNSKNNVDNATINNTTDKINGADTLNMVDTVSNDTQENGVQSSVNRVTEEVHNAMNKVGLNVSESATGIQEANTKFMSNNDNLFDRNYVSNYANDFVQAMSEKNGRSYTVLSQETDNLADELVNKTLTGNSVLDGNREFQTVVRNFKDVLREGIKKNANLHNNVYGANEVLNAQVQDIENGDYSSLNITENPSNNVTFAPITENEQNIGYVIERDNGYSNELSESDFTVKQKNGEYGTRNGITYGHFGTHQNSNGNNIVSYLPTGNAVAILPNQNSAIEFMKQAENETSGYSIYLYDDNGVTKTGGDMSQFINVLNNAKNAVQVEQNSGNIGMQNNTGVLNNAESENISSQAPNIDENINTVRTDDTVKSIEISAEDKIPGLLQDEYSDLLSLEDRTALDTLGSAIGVPIKIVPTISNDANGCYYKGVIYISLSADDKVMTVFSHELTHYLEDTLDYTEYKKCVLDFIQKNTDKSIDELVKEKVDTYAKSSIYLTYEEATREIVADYTQNILKDADAVMEFVDSIENKEQRRGVIRRLLDAIKELINKIKAKFGSKHSQMQELQKTHDLLEDMLKEAAENIGSNNGSKTRYSYAGTKAETANITQLSRAKEMELNGEKAETIRAKTGWNRGLDGKWRFEIDDSKMEFDKGGITSNPDVARKKELEMKFINGTITEQEQSELNGLINTTKEVRKPSVLQDYIKHDELFRAYPFLKTVDVEFDTSMQKGEHGKYTPSLNTITLNAYDSSNQDKSTLIHEIQHAIQHYEGFATGANVEYWKVKNGQDIESLEREIRKNSRVLELYQDAANNVFDKLVDFDDFEDKTGLDFINLFDEDNMKKSKAYLKEKLPEGLYEVSEGYIDRGKEYAEKYISLMKKLRTLKEQTAMDLYKNTAGEIEARDVQNRMNMTEEERKNTFPESMKKNGDVVFANAMNNRDTEYAKEQSDSNSESDKNVKYSFGGKNSKTADIGLLKQAENLEKDGASAEEIRKETGWSRGLDNKWKFEIDDSQAKYNEDKIRLGKAVSLNEVLEHKDLFKAYPDLKKVKVKEISNLDANGIYSPNFDCIFINENLPTQEKLKSLIHEVQHAIQVREGFAVGESPDNENRNRSAGEIEADDVKSRQSMSKEERLNTFPKSMKPNQNADVAFWENSKSNEYGDVNIDEDMGIRYNDDIDIPYREKKQLDEYVISANNRANKLKTLDYKEIGNNFYIWRNNSKTDFKVLMQIEIDGNEDFIDNLREELYNEETKEIDTSAEGFTAWVEDIQSGRGVYNSNNVDDTEGISNRNDDRLYDKSRKSNARRTTIQSNGNQQIEGEILLKNLNNNPNQIKSATDNIGTFDKNNADIRYSSQKSKPTTVHSVSKKLISDYGVESKVKPSDISEAIADITSKINDTYYGEGDINKKYAKLEKAAYGVAEKIVDQMKKKDNYAEEIYNNLRKEIKSTKIRISEVDKGDFTEWNDFRKQNFGYLTISNKEGIPVDSYYKELAQEYPGIFDESTHMAVGDQLRNIVDTLRNLKPKEYDLSTEERDEMLEEVANEVILRSINLADDMGYIDKNGNADKIYTESDMRGALDKQKERLNNKHEKQLDRQKERLENKYEKRLETQKAKYIEQREKIRKQLIDKVNKQKEKAKARKKESEDRTKLLKLAREINSMKLSPQDKNKLPDILKEIDTVSKGILKKGYTTKDGKAVMGELDLKQLKEDYELLKQDENFLPDKDVELKISRLDKMQIADMNINDVRDLIQTLQEVKHEIRTKDKMINDVRNREIAHIAVECIKEIQHSKGIEDDRKGARYRGYISTHLTPERMFRRLSGYAKNGVFEGLAKDLSDGQRKSMTFKQRASEKFGKFTEKETEKMSKFTGKKAELIDISKYDTQGRKVYITPDMRVSLYLHSKNYSNLKHIQYGGITIPNWNLYKQGKIKEAYESAGITIRLTPSQVNEITKQMTPFEKSFADVAYNFFNVDCTKAINETSLALKGYEIATVKDYFPIVSDENFVNKDFETLVKNGTLEAKGMLKERKNAANPVRLESVIRVINRHMENVGDYYGLAIPIRNFNKVYNSMGKNYNYSVKQSLKQKWGSKADDYIKHLITDLQGGRKTDITLFDILKGNYAQAVLTLNAGVVFQQTASYPLAAAIVGYKALAKAFTERVTKADIEIINKHTPLLWYRSQGYTTTELGDYANGNFEDWTKKGKMPWLMGAIQAMDILTTTKLWKAAEFYVRDNYKELEQGTDEYYDKVADVYNRIIENTQPNYSIMQRPDVLRNPNALIKALTMFKTVTLQCFNLVYDAYGEYRARYREYQANKTKESAENLKSSSRKLGTTISALIVSILTLGVFKGVGRYTKGKFQDYYGDADNDNEITFKSLMLAYGADIFNGIAGNAIGGSEVASLVEYILSIFDIGNAVWYDVQAPALDTVNGVVGGITKLLLTIEKNGLSNPHAYVKAVIKLLETLGNATGVPVKNAKDLIYGISKDITDVTHTKNIFDILE